MVAPLLDCMTTRRTTYDRITRIRPTVAANAKPWKSDHVVGVPSNVVVVCDRQDHSGCAPLSMMVRAIAMVSCEGVNA